MSLKLPCSPMLQLSLLLLVDVFGWYGEEVMALHNVRRAMFVAQHLSHTSFHRRAPVHVYSGDAHSELCCADVL